VFGILGLGHAESLKFTPYEQQYAELVSSERLYRRIS
jgi:chemotaxis protein methyltransferase CheR